MLNKSINSAYPEINTDNIITLQSKRTTHEIFKCHHESLLQTQLIVNLFLRHVISTIKHPKWHFEQTGFYHRIFQDRTHNNNIYILNYTPQPRYKSKCIYYLSGNTQENWGWVKEKILSTVNITLHTAILYKEKRKNKRKEKTWGYFSSYSFYQLSHTSVNSSRIWPNFEIGTIYRLATTYPSFEVMLWFGSIRTKFWNKYKVSLGVSSFYKNYKLYRLGVTFPILNFDFLK